MLNQIAGTPNPVIRCRRATAAQPEQRLKRRHRLPPAVVSKHKLVEVRLKLRLADAVIGTDQPLLQVPDRTIGQRNDRHRTASELGPGRLVPGTCLTPVADNRSKLLYASV